MFGLEALLGGLAAKLALLAAAVAAVVATYLGIRRQGAEQARQEARQEAQEQRAATQARVDDARRQDAAVDDATRQEVEAIQEATPPPPDPKPVKPGDVFKFGFILALLLAGCARTPTAVAPVYLDIPPAPQLVACPDAPHPDGIAEERGGQVVIVLELADAQRIREYLRTAPGCWQTREALLRGWAEKLANRIRAVSGPR
jgi:hypothetical protein